MKLDKTELELVRDLLDAHVENLEESFDLSEDEQKDLDYGRSALEKVNIELDLVNAENQ